MGESPAVRVTSADVTVTADDERGYAYTSQMQETFDHAARVLLENDGWTDPAGRRILRADLALEGGGVKGIGLVGAISVLADAGYTFRGVAGTSAGAIAAALVAALSSAGEPMTHLKGCMNDLPFAKFAPPGLGHLGDRGPAGWAAKLLAAAELPWKKGLGSGNALAEWLTPVLEGLGVRTFHDLRLDPALDKDMSLESDRQFRLVVHTADIARKELVRLPWDYGLYGCNPDDQRVVDAVRASMSIPFFFEPVTFDSGDAGIPIPLPGGGTTVVTYAAGEETWVDGGMLRNFPIDAFDRIDGKEPRWPTIGIKLSSMQSAYPSTRAARSSLGIARGCATTLLNEWDSFGIEETTAARTIFVDHGTIRTTDFGLSQVDKDGLFRNGVVAATNFVLEMAELRRVPRTAGEAQVLVNARRWGKALDADHDVVVDPSGACRTCGVSIAADRADTTGHVPSDRDAVGEAADWMKGRPASARRVVVHRGRAELV